MMPSITVKVRTRAALAPFRVPLTESVNCWFAARAMYLGKLAVEEAALSAALQLARRFSLALAMELSAESAEDWSRKTTKRRERIGYAIQARERRWGSSRYGLREVDIVES